MKLFVGENCSKCKEIKKWFKENNIKCTYVNTDYVEGMAEGAFYDIAELPTLMLEDGTKLIGDKIKEKFNDKPL